MKLAEAIRTSKALKEHKGVVWLLSSYYPSFFQVFLQASLAINLRERVPAVRSFDFDTLSRSIEETSTGQKRFDQAVLSLVWEDFIPAWGWRSRQASLSSFNSAFIPSEDLRKCIVHWVKQRTDGGAQSVVILPPMSWLPLMWTTPPPFRDEFQLMMSKWANEIAIELRQAGSWVIDLGEPPLDLRGLIQSGCPWTLDLARQTSKQIADLLGPPQERVKALIIDLDNTLWAGVVEDGSAIRLAREESHNNTPHRLLAVLLLKIKANGVYLCCCSKNDEALLHSYFSELSPVLRFEDFNATWISWGSKSVGVKRICVQLNILPKNVLFVDDNPAEILEVQSVNPEVRSVAVPGNISDWPAFLSSLQAACFWPFGVPEDALRVNDPRIAQRETLTEETPHRSHREYLKSLELHVLVKQRQWQDPRTLDLLNKTNQFTLNGQRYALSQLIDYSQRPGSWCSSVSLKDIHGSFGTIGVMFGQYGEGRLVIDAFALSCRAFDRNVEYAFLHALLQAMPCTRVSLCAKETERNGHVQRFLESLGMTWSKPEIDDLVELRCILQEKIQESGLKVEVA